MVFGAAVVRGAGEWVEVEVAILVLGYVQVNWLIERRSQSRRLVVASYLDQHFICYCPLIVGHRDVYFERDVMNMIVVT